jgi:hypothetical protein
VVTAALAAAALGLLVLLSGLGLGSGTCPAAEAALPAPESALAAARALAPGVALVEPADTPTPSLAGGCEGKIRPGAPLLLDDRWVCTASFVFRDAEGSLYVGTAGHCLRPGTSKVGVAGVGEDVGDVAFSTGDAGAGQDFGLVRIDPAYYASVEPSMCRWGGPSGMYRFDDQHHLLLHYGWGLGYDALPASRGRAGLMPSYGWLDDGTVAYVTETNAGDSGSPLMTEDGRAVGVHTHTSGLANVPGAGFGLKFGTRLDQALALAEQGTGRAFALVPGGAPVGLAGLGG